MKLVLDTNTYSVQILNDPTVTKYVTEDNFIYLPSIVIGELRGGFDYGSRTAANHALLNEFLQAPNTDILHVTEETTQLYAEIFAYLRDIGRPLNTNDIWIAAICLENNLPLLTKDQDFKHIKNLRLL
jgi:tRNA(fMet)-specific endonuclease VapC